MPSSPKIPKEMILEYALKLLIRDGYSNLNIKALAGEIGCSTQPISWHFGNMEKLRISLSEYALNYANNKMNSDIQNPVEAFRHVGTEYVKMAIYEPNLFRFLYLEGYSGRCADNFNALQQNKENAEIIKRISAESDVSPEKIGELIMNTIIYTHGIASMIATGIIHTDEDKAMMMVKTAFDAFALKIKEK